MSYRLPPLNGLKAFEAAARHLSFKKAADELSVTPGAVSQQVKALETALGVTLFRRLHRSLVLTPTGEAYLPMITDAFHRISGATEAVAESFPGRRLRLGISPRVAADPAATLARLADRESYNDVVAVSGEDDVALLLDGSLDALLRLGDGPYPGLHAERVALDDAFAPCAEAMLVVQPGLATCREYRATKDLLTGR